MLVFVAFLMVILVTMTVFSVDVAYMQLVRTQLQVAADSASKAGVEALTRTGDENAAVAAAIAAAARNEVAGAPLVISASDVRLGRGSADADGNWIFDEGTAPYTAVRVDVAMNDSTSSGSVNLLFGSAIGQGQFTPAESSTAAHLDQEIVLCIDRSHSMCFDEAGVTWQYPSGWGGWQYNSSYNYWYYVDPLTLAPHPTGSRWASLADAVELFLTTVETRNLEPRVACVTWGSSIGYGSYEYSLTGQTAEEVTTDVTLGTDFDGIEAAIAARGNNVMLGGTKMSAGMQRAIDILTANDVRPLANKTIILMTDGKWNQGTDPTTLAQTAYDNGIVIHTVTFIPGADQTTMQEVASITGGTHYHADNGTELQAAFEELALTLPIVLTE